MSKKYSLSYYYKQNYFLYSSEIDPLELREFNTH